MADGDNSSVECKFQAGHDAGLEEGFDERAGLRPSMGYGFDVGRLVPFEDRYGGVAKVDEIVRLID